MPNGDQSRLAGAGSDPTNSIGSWPAYCRRVTCSKPWPFIYASPRKSCSDTLPVSACQLPQCCRCADLVDDDRGRSTRSIVLIDMWSQDIHVECIGAETGRSPGGVRSKARRLGLYRRERRNIVRYPASGTARRPLPRLLLWTRRSRQARLQLSARPSQWSLTRRFLRGARSADRSGEGRLQSGQRSRSGRVRSSQHAHPARPGCVRQWRQTSKAAHRVERRPRSRTGAPLVCLAMPQGYRQGSEAVRGSRAFPRDSHGSSAARPEKDRAGLRRWPSLRQKPRRFACQASM